MANKEWRDINDFYFVRGKKEPKPEHEDIEEPQEEQREEKVLIEVRLSKPLFIKPGEGYIANKPCKMQVSAEFLEETNRKRVTFDVYSSYNKGKEVQEYSGLEGFIKDDFAVAEMKYLPLNEDYVSDNTKAEDATYEIRFVVLHTKGEKPVESDVLVMPYLEKKTGSVSILFFSETDEVIENISVKLTADNEEIFSGEIDEGVLEITDIEESELLLEFEYDGKTIQRKLLWIDGNQSLTEEIITLSKENKEAATQ